MKRGSIKVLVVDDDSAVREALKVRLSAAGYPVDAVSCGEDALLACSPRAPDIMILDVSMPGMDGYQVCERLRESIDDPVAVIFLTGTTQMGASSWLEQRVNQSGGDYFLVKPYDPVLLIELIDRVAGECQAPAATPR